MFLRSLVEAVMEPFVIYFLMSFFEVVLAGSPVLHSCCEYNETIGYRFGFPDCEDTHPNRLFNPWANHEIVHQIITCSGHFEWFENEFQIDDNGIVHIPGPNDECFNGRVPDGLVDVAEYCLDYNIMDEISTIHVCEESKNSNENYLELSIASIISSISLFIIVIVYSMKPSRRWANTAYVISLSVALTLAFVNLTWIQLYQHSGCSGCLLAGYCLQYFFLAAFCWMNARCVNLFLRICILRPQTGSSAYDSMRRNKFIRTSLYSWGMPLVIGVTTFVLQAYDLLPDPQFRPDLGYHSCFFDSWKTKWIYFYGPMSIIMFVNAMLFLLTFYNLFKHRLLTKNVRQANRTQLQRELWFFKQYLKLFIATGLSWTGEMIGFAYRKQNGLSGKLEYVWRATDIINCLQGVFMFIIFAYDQRVMRNLKWPLLLKKCICSGDQDVTSNVNISGTTSTNVTTSGINSQTPLPQIVVKFDKDNNEVYLP